MATLSCFTPTKKMNNDPRRHSMATPSRTPGEGTAETSSILKSSPRLSLSFEQDESYDTTLLTDEDMKNLFSFRKSKSKRELEASEPLLAEQDDIQDEIMTEAPQDDQLPQRDMTMAEFLREDSIRHPMNTSQSPVRDHEMATSQSATFTALPTAPTNLDLQAAAATPLPATPQSQQPQPETISRKPKRKNISLSLPMRSVKRVFTGKSNTSDNNTGPTTGLRRFYKRDEPEFEMLTPSNRASVITPPTQEWQSHLPQAASGTERITTTTPTPAAAAGPSTGGRSSSAATTTSQTQRQPSDTNKQLPVLSENSLQEINNYADAPMFAPPLPTPTLANMSAMHASPANVFVRPRAPSRADLSAHITQLHKHIADLNLENQILRDQVSLVRRDWIDTAGSLDLERHRSFTAEMECFRWGVRVEELEGEIRRLRRGSDLA